MVNGKLLDEIVFETNDELLFKIKSIYKFRNDELVVSDNSVLCRYGNYWKDCLIELTNKFNLNWNFGE